jgi:hypothetical protein
MDGKIKKAGLWVLVAIGSVLGLSCVSTGRLGQYEFQGRPLAAVMKAPPRAEVFTDFAVWIDPNDVVGTALRAGTAIAKQVEAQQVRDLMREAVARAEIPEQVRRRILEKGSQILNCDPVQYFQQSEVFLDLKIRRYGIDAGSPFASVQFVIDIKARLRDTRTGARIWRASIRESEPISPSVFGLGEIVGNIVSAVVLAELSEDEIASGLQRLADDAADRVCARLQQAYLESRFIR